MKSIVCRFAQAKRFIHSSAAMRAAEAHHGSANVMTINFSTPHSNIYRKKEVTSIVLPGESGDFGVTAGHAAYIAQLQAGVVQINHANVSEMIVSHNLLRFLFLFLCFICIG